MRYKIIGSGVPVLLIHGYGFDNSIWNTCISEFAENKYKLIIPVLPGFGNSKFPNKKVSIPDLAEEIFRIMDHENISEPIIIIGHSMGGYVAMEMAAQQSSRVRALGILHAHAFADTLGKVKERKKSIQFIENYGSERYAQATIPHLFDQIYSKRHPVQIKEYINHAAAIAPEIYINYLKAMAERRDTSFMLKEMGIPVLYIFGENDTTAPLEICLKQVEMSKISKIHILKSMGHMGFLEKSGETAKVLEEFIALSEITIS